MIVTTKILLEIPLLYDEIIYDEFAQRENIKAVKILLFRQLKKNSRKQELIWYRKLN